jgi:Uma2 family endonuclease
VWVVDPDEKCIHIYAPGKPARRFTPPDTLTDPVLPGFDLPLSELFR